MQQLWKLVDEFGMHLLPVIVGLVFIVLILSFVDRPSGSDHTSRTDGRKRFPQDPGE